MKRLFIVWACALCLLSAGVAGAESASQVTGKTEKLSKEEWHASLPNSLDDSQDKESLQRDLNKFLKEHGTGQDALLIYASAIYMLDAIEFISSNAYTVASYEYILKNGNHDEKMEQFLRDHKKLHALKIVKKHNDIVKFYKGRMTVDTMGVISRFYNYYRSNVPPVIDYMQANYDVEMRDAMDILAVNERDGADEQSVDRAEPAVGSMD
jgi:hypothetical protein